MDNQVKKDVIHLLKKYKGFNLDIKAEIKGFAVKMKIINLQLIVDNHGIALSEKDYFVFFMMPDDGFEKITHFKNADEMHVDGFLLEYQGGDSIHIDVFNPEED